MQKIRATAIVIKDNLVLVVQRYRDGQTYFVLPGGKVEEGESPEQAVIRELYEETSIKAVIKEKVFEFEDKEQRLHQLFLCELISGQPELRKDSPEFSKMNENNSYFPRWVSVQDIKTNVIWPETTKESLLSLLKNP